MMEMLFSALGGAWRVFDGMGYGRGSMRVLIGFIVAISAAWWTLEPPGIAEGMTAITVAVGAVLSLTRGFGGWERFSVRQITQYWYAAVPLHLVWYIFEPDYGIAVYLALLVLAGLAHPLSMKYLGPRCGARSHIPTRAAEFAAGACVIGGVGVL